jgi:membrane-associated protein
VFDLLLDTLSSSAWTYLIVLAIVGVDAFFPLVPGETAAITASILSAQGQLSIGIVVLAAFVGATAGDNVSYLLGDRLGAPAAHRLFCGDKARRRLDWAHAQLRDRGALLIVGARFIPGGRTAVTFAAGTLDMTWRRFITGDLAGALAWSVLVCALGYVGGEAFRQSVWKPLLISLAVSTLVMLAGEVWRRRRAARTDAGAAAQRTPVEEAFARMGAGEDAGRA